MFFEEVKVWSKERQHLLELEIKRKGAEIVRFVDLSRLSEKLNRGFDKAILIGVLLSKDYIKNISNSSQTDISEFSQNVHRADELAEWITGYLQECGYNAFAQSAENLFQNDFFDTETKSSVLPHKTIALLAGLGWIGKNNLLITEEYGCAFCMCTVLTDAPIIVKNPPLISSKCGDCEICKQVCPTNAIYGNNWEKKNNRSLLIDVSRCERCLKCLSHCHWTANYVNNY